MNFAENLKIAREKNNLSKAELARKLNIPYTTYNNYEAGTGEPRLEILAQIAKILNVSIDALLDVHGKDKFTQLKEMVENEGFFVSEYIDEYHNYSRAMNEIRTIYIGEDEKNPTCAMPKKEFIEVLSSIIKESEIVTKKIIREKIRLLFSFGWREE